MNDKEQFLKDPKHVPGEVFSHLPRPKQERTIPNDSVALFGVVELWKLPILLTRRPGKSEVNVAFQFEQGYMAVNLKSEELEELAKTCLDAAHHLRTQPDF